MSRPLVFSPSRERVDGSSGMRISTLQVRLVVFLLLPVAMVLIGAGVAGFVRARETILQEWREAASLSLERATHEVDMKLGELLGWIQAFHESFQVMGSHRIQSWILDQMRRQSWVMRVRWASGYVEEKGLRPLALGAPHHEHDPTIEENNPVASYGIEAQPGEGSVTMKALVGGEGGKPVGTIFLDVDLRGLLADALKYGWRKAEQACLVTEDGKFLAHEGTLIISKSRLGENGDPLELKILSETRKNFSGTVWGPGTPPELIAGFRRLQTAPWTMILFARGKDVLAPLLSFRDYYLVVSAITVVAILLMIRWVVGPRAKIIQELSKAAGEVARGNYISMEVPRGKDEITHLVESFNEMVEGLKERDFLSNTFGRYVDHEIAKEILKSPDATRLGGQKRTVAILIADLRDFTPLAESLTPERTIDVLNRFFGMVIEIIRDHKGIIVDFFGDSVLAFFDPLEAPTEKAIERAARCAFEMQNAMISFNEANKQKGLPLLQMGVGIHAGEVIVGNIGSESRAKYGIVGSAVNLTQRIQQLAGPGDVVVSDDFFMEGSKWLRPKQISEASLKGVKNLVKVYWVESNFSSGSGSGEGRQ